MIFASIFIILQLIPIPGLKGVSFTWQSYILFGVWIILGLFFMWIKRKDIGLSTSSFISFINKVFKRKENVIIMAAGLGNRMLPLTLKTPKPLLKVNGTPMIETIIDAILSKRKIKHIYIVVGYKKEQFNYLSKKYNNVSFIENNEYETVNNISSIKVSCNVLKENRNVFIFEGDLVVSDNNIFNDKLNSSCYFAKFIKGKSNDWVFNTNNKGIITRVGKGGIDVFNMCGISYFLANDASKLADFILDEYKNNNKYKTMFWDEVVDKHLDELTMVIKEVKSSQICELDTPEEMLAFEKKKM